MQKFTKTCYFLLTTLLVLLNFTFNFKPEAKKGDITSRDIKNNPHYRKECTIKEKCRECTFDELKTMGECQITGHKLIKHCVLYDDLKVKDEYYYNEHCNEKTKINSVYYFLFFNVIIFILSFYIRSSHKKAILSQTFEKLTILRKKA